MAFKINTTSPMTDDGIPFLWGSGDQTTAPTVNAIAYASDGASNDYYGISVAVGNGRIIVGAPRDDDNGSSSGSAYILDLGGNQITKIKPSDGAASDEFGTSVAIGNGRIVVGSYLDDDNGTDSGSAYIFNLDGTQLAKIKPSDGGVLDYFGEAVAIGSGRIVVGMYGDDDNGLNSGAAYIFSLSGTQLAKIKPSDGVASDVFGTVVSVGSGRIIASSYFDDDNGSNSGSAYIFDLSGSQLAKIKASDGAADDYFGYSVSIGCGRVVVGAPYHGDGGAIYIFDLDGVQLKKINPPDAFTFLFGIDLCVGSGRILVASNTSVHIYDLDGKLIGLVEENILGDPKVAAHLGKIVVGQNLASSNGVTTGAATVYDTPIVYTPYDVIDLNSYGQ